MFQNDLWADSARGFFDFWFLFEVIRMVPLTIRDPLARAINKRLCLGLSCQRVHSLRPCRVGIKQLIQLYLCHKIL